MGDLILQTEVSNARRALIETRPEFRGWEWRYLSSASNSAALVLGKSRVGFCSVLRVRGAPIILAGALDGSVWAWDADTGKFLYTIKHHDAPILDIAVEENLRTGISLAVDGTYSRFDCRRGDEFQRGKGGRVTEVEDPAQTWSGVYQIRSRIGAISPGGRRVAWLENGPARVFDLDTGETVPLKLADDLEFELISNKDQAQWADWIGEDLVIAFARNLPGTGSKGEGYLLYFDQEGNEIPDRRLTQFPNLVGNARVDVSESGVLVTLKDQVLVHRFSNTIREGESAERPRWKRLEGHRGQVGHRGEVHAVALSPDARTAVTGGGSIDLRALVWNAETAKPVGEKTAYMSSRGVLHGHEEAILSVAIDEGSGTVLSASGDGTVRVWNLRNEPWMRRSGKPVDEPEKDAKHLHVVKRVSFSRDGRYLYATTLKPAVLVIDTELATSSEPISGELWDRVLALDPSVSDEPARAVLLTRAGDGRFDVRVATLTARRGVIATSDALLELSESAVEQVAAAVDPRTGRLAVFAPREESIVLYLFDELGFAEYGEPREIPVEPDVPTSLCFSDDGRLLAVGVNRELARSGEVSVYDVESGERLVQQSLGPVSLTRICFSHRGDEVFAASDAWRIFCISIPDGRIREFATRSSRVNGIAVSPDDTRLITGSESAWIRIYDIPSGQVLLELPEVDTFIPDVAWDPRDRYVAAAGGYDLSALLYRTKPDTHVLAWALVERLRRQHPLTSSIIDDLQGMDEDVTGMVIPAGTDSDEVRKEALSLARMFGPDPDHLDSVSWSMVVDAGASAKKDICRQALSLSIRALELRDSWRHRRTVGLARLRNGHHPQALTEFEASLAEAPELFQPSLRILVAITRYHLEQAGDPAHAAAQLEAVLQEVTRELDVDTETRKDPAASGFLEEARSMLAGGGTPRKS